MTEQTERLLVAVFFVLDVVLALPVFTPNLTDIGAFDEAVYVDMGRTVGTELPALNNYPLPVLLFALTYVPVQKSDFWLIHSCSIGRFLLFALLWISSYILAKRISEISSPLIMIGFLLLSPVAISLTGNAAHALFAAMSAFALGQVILFHRGKELGNLWKASVFVSLAVLSRVGEGTLLFCSLIAVSIPLGISARRIKAVLAALIIPFVLLVGGYMLTYYSFTGKSPLGPSKYFYTAFENGHGQAYAEKFPGLNYYVEGEVESARLFGAAEENQYSIIAAIRRNPMAYLSRVPRLARAAISGAISIYGGPLSLWFFLLAIQGCIWLIRKKEVLLLCILLSWVSYLVIYILVVFQGTHLLLPFPVLFTLASVGLTSVLSLSSKQQYIWSAMLLGLVALAVERNSSYSFISSPLVLLIGLWTVWTVLRRFGSANVVIPSALLFLLGVMSLFREGVPSQRMRRLGSAPDERAVLFLKRNFEKGAAIGAYPASIPLAAKMRRVSLVNRRSEVRSEQDLQQWIINNDLKAIYVERDLRRLERSLSVLIESQIGKTLDIAFSSDERNIQILRVNNPSTKSSLQ